MPETDNDEPVPVLNSAQGKRTILYIEDNLSNLNLVQEILRQQPQVELLSAMQGRLGLDLARKHSPDLILLDVHLPDLDGWDVFFAITGRGSNTKDSGDRSQCRRDRAPDSTIHDGGRA